MRTPRKNRNVHTSTARRNEHFRKIAFDYFESNPILFRFSMIAYCFQFQLFSSGSIDGLLVKLHRIDFRNECNLLSLRK